MSMKTLPGRSAISDKFAIHMRNQAGIEPVGRERASLERSPGERSTATANRSSEPPSSATRRKMFRKRPATRYRVRSTIDIIRDEDPFDSRRENAGTDPRIAITDATLPTRRRTVPASGSVHSAGNAAVAENEARLRSRRRYGYAPTALDPDIAGLAHAMMYSPSSSVTPAQVPPPPEGGEYRPFHGMDERVGMFRGNYLPWDPTGGAPAVVRQDTAPPLFNGGGGPWYGRYVGPAGPADGPPITPVDAAAYLHDKEYAEIDERYGFSEAEFADKYLGEGSYASGNGFATFFGWTGRMLSLNTAAQIEWTWADMKLIGRSWSGVIGGIFDGSYSGWEGFKTGINDLAWAIGITLTHTPMIIHRLIAAVGGAVYGVVAGVAGGIKKLGESIGGPLGGLISAIGQIVGETAKLVAAVFSVVNTVSAFMQMAVGAVYGIGVGAVLYAAGAIIESVGKAAEKFFKGLGNVAKSIVKGIKSVGQKVKNVVKKVGRSVGCFITEAVARTRGEPDDGPILTQIRSFRDSYIAGRRGGVRLIRSYYSYAPKMVARIDRRPDREKIWHRLYREYIIAVLEAIGDGDKRRAMEIYIAMINHVSELTGVPIQTDGPTVTHWKRAY